MYRRAAPWVGWGGMGNLSNFGWVQLNQLAEFMFRVSRYSLVRNFRIIPITSRWTTFWGEDQEDFLVQSPDPDQISFFHVPSNLSFCAEPVGAVAESINQEIPLVLLGEGRTGVLSPSPHTP